MDYVDPVKTEDDVINNLACSLRDKWRKESGKKDDEILVEKLVELGWKFSHKVRRWYHPKYPALHQPGLDQLCLWTASVAVNSSR